jgi:hypothetical protein
MASTGSEQASSAGPFRENEKPMLLSQIAGGGRHNRSLANQQFLTLPNRLPHVVLADEVERFCNRFGRHG